MEGGWISVVAAALSSKDDVDKGSGTVGWADLGGACDGMLTS